jgi:putative endonuclease
LRAESGRRAEEAAAALLQGKGLKILERNFFARAGEVDIIAKDEVRARAGMSWGGAAASVIGSKKRRVVTAAKVWLAKTGWEGACRFDVVAQEGEQFEHYEAVFDADGR